MVNKTTDMLLKRDSLDSVEKILGGKHHSKFSQAESMFALAMCLSDNLETESHLKEVGDTFFSMTWDGFKALIVQNGFKMALSYRIERHFQSDEVALFHNTEKGLVIFADSYGDSVNSGTLYGEVTCRVGHENEIFCAISTGGCTDQAKGIWETSHDVREGLLHKIARLEEHATFNPVWEAKDRFLWFLDSTETKSRNYDHKAITQKKIELCPLEFRKIVGK